MLRYLRFGRIFDCTMGFPPRRDVGYVTQLHWGYQIGAGRGLVWGADRVPWQTRRGIYSRGAQEAKMGPCEDSGSTQAHSPSAPGMLRLSSGKSGRCSRPETKTEPAKEKVEYDYSGIWFNSSGTLRGRTLWVDRNGIWRILSYVNGKYLVYLTPYS